MRWKPNPYGRTVFTALAVLAGLYSAGWHVLNGLSTCDSANNCVSGPIWSQGLVPFLVGLVTTPVSFGIGLFGAGLVLGLLLVLVLVVTWPITRLRGHRPTG